MSGQPGPSRFPVLDDEALALHAACLARCTNIRAILDNESGLRLPENRSTGRQQSG
ncbi:uncharacterized protein FFNC_00651 [Fusarium fujikuroi]|nr:uncharacterized protein FFNC_00651 [Fusarium fujikuroi]